jgi:hypothetical protein
MVDKNHHRCCRLEDVRSERITYAQRKAQPNAALRQYVKQPREKLVE